MVKVVVHSDVRKSQINKISMVNSQSIWDAVYMRESGSVTIHRYLIRMGFVMM